LNNPPPAAKSADVFNGALIGTQHSEGASIAIYESVLEAVLAYSEIDLSCERGGFLLGRVFEETPARVLVRHFLPAAETQSNAAALTFTHDTWAALHKQIAQRFPHERVIGWQHTHPRLGVFLSAHDRFIHRNFFEHPWQIALVVDPVQCELGFFHWRQDEIENCGFICVPGQPA